MKRLPLTSTKDILEHLLYVVFYRKILILTLFFLMALLLFGGVYLITPKYEATAEILVHANPLQQLLPFKDITYPPEYNPHINTALEIVQIGKSREIVEVIVKKYHLDKRYEKRQTDPQCTRDVIIFYIKKPVRSMKDFFVELGWLEPSKKNYIAEAVDELMEENLSLELVEDTQIVDITVEEESPELSTNIANDIAALLINKALALVQTESNIAYEFNKGQIGTVEFKYFESIKTLAEFKEQWNVVSLEDEENLKLNRLEELRGQLAFLQGDIKQTLARYEEISRELLKQSQRLGSLKIYNEMKEQEVLTRVELSGIRAKERSLLKSIVELEDQLQALVKRENDFVLLEQKVKNDEEIYLGLKEKLSKLGVQKDSQLSEFDLKVINLAYVAPEADPDWPQLFILIPVILILSLTFAIGMTFFVEYWSDTFTNVSRIEEEMELPVLGVIPSCMACSCSDTNQGHSQEGEIRSIEN